jgi:hypothetical protein
MEKRKRKEGRGAREKTDSFYCTANVGFVFSLVNKMAGLWQTLTKLHRPNESAMFCVALYTLLVTL